MRQSFWSRTVPPEVARAGARTRLRAYGAASLVLLFGSFVTFRLAWLQHGERLQERRTAVRVQLDPVRSELAGQLNGALQLTRGIASLVAVQGDISAAEFSSFAEHLVGQSRIIHNLALAPNNVITQVYPVEGNERAVGLAFVTRPDQWSSVQRMMAERRIVVANPVELVQGGTGVIGWTPIYLPGRGADQPRYWGLVCTVLDFGLLMGGVERAASSGDLSLALRVVDGLGATGRVFWGDAAVFDEDPVIEYVPLPSGSWQLAARPRQGWPAFAPYRSTWFVAGEVLTLSLALLLFNLMRVAQSRQREVLARRRTEAALRQTNRALRLFSLAKGAVLRATDDESLLAEICRIAVESAGYRMAWIGRAEHDEHKTVRPIAFAGNGAGFLDRITVSWGEGELGRGTAGIAIRTRAPALARDLLTIPEFSPWREVLRTRDYASAIAVPLIVQGDVFGVLLIYAVEVDAFDDTEVGLLEDLGATIAYGMEALKARRERDLAMQSLEAAHAELERRVIERTRELELAKDAAESADRTKSAFLATMSHELRTPLNSIIGFTGILLQRLPGPLNPEQTKQLGMVQSSARHLLALINDVLDISKIEAGQLELSDETVDVRDCVDHALSVIRPIAEKKGLVVRDGSSAPSVSLRGDRRRIEQVLLNLLSNAIKFTDRGEVAVEVAGRDGAVVVAVRDTGIGISAAELPHLFRPFRQLETGLTRRHEGTGLGLAICRRLVELMHGEIAVQSEPGVGSVFSFTLPAHEAER